MTLAQYFSSQFTGTQILDFCLRLVLACLCGAAIGYERTKRFKEAGIRTHIIVSCGAALYMLVSKYGFVDIVLADGNAINGMRTADPSRVAAQVVSGISFLGAGVIVKNKTDGIVKGLTTAAGLWATAGIGLAVGAGMFRVAVFATLLLAILQTMMHRFAVGADAYDVYRIHFVVRNGTDFREELDDQLGQWNAQISEGKVSRRDDGTTVYDLMVRARKEISYEDVERFMDAHEEILSAGNDLL